ncbi:LytTR family DNA-binding domain-containing protein [Chitinophaga pendula]|uniref:LytR/AlgR family response regulator transcription factor n=1 Tax=Chitinophaga TaxID=79328 RepID=UPI000BAFDBCB|nr:MULTISPECIES: LytTR family DNA-binding domain-containing protein [Chitinophaga]ASZ12432.1 DNA-binding response regulator [Chitinophaga sp. MD30]UCJ09971.1 LytTR family DNA-binding domain-containing protein [Chitinophaga pendula]
MIKTVIIDDVPMLRRDLLEMMARYNDFIVIAECGSIKDAIPVLRATQPQLLLLDIALDDGDAFELLAHFRPLPFHVIFVTAYAQHAIQAIRLGALDYLLKPVQEDELRNALERVRQETLPAPTLPMQLDIAGTSLRKQFPNDRIVLRTQEALKLVLFEEITYCQGNAGYTHFLLTGNRKIVVSGNIKEYEELLPSHLFIRCHQSYLVNYHYVDSFKKEGLLVLKTGETIPVSNRKKDLVVQFLTGQ